MSSNETKTYALELFHNLGRWLRARWFRLRHPGLAMLADQMTSTGVFFDCTVIPPNAGSELVIEWFEERMAYADRSAMQFCFIRLVPPSVDVNQRGWAERAVKLCSWGDYPATWKTEGVPMLIANVPSPHERLYLSMLCTLPLDDDDGTPMPAWGASVGQLSSA